MTPPDWLLDLARTAAGSSFFWTGFWAFCFGIAFILIFCKHIAAFIGRTKKLGAGKWAAEAEEQKSEQKIPAPVALAPAGGGTADPRTAADELLAQLTVTPFMRAREDALKGLLADRGLDPGSPEAYRVLTAYTALGLALAEFEVAYSNIWTTQIQLLSEANTHELTDEELRYFYDLGAAASPNVYANHPFPAYVRFLTAQDLLVKVPSGKHSITVKGRAFLAYLVQEGRSLTGRLY